jgi:hypothetical protein
LNPPPSREVDRKEELEFWRIYFCLKVPWWKGSLLNLISAAFYLGGGEIRFLSLNPADYLVSSVLGLTLLSSS